MTLEGRVILVTGAARRVGRAIALRLAGPGRRLALHYRASERESAQAAEDCARRGAEVERFDADLADPAAPAALIERVLRRFGRLDAVVNNAALFEPMTLDDFDAGAWGRTLQINLTAPLLLVHAARDALRAAGGRVVNLCDAATGRPWPDHLAYVVSKGALEALTRVLARALAPRVNVVGVAPGVVAWPEHYDAQTRARLAARIPLGHAGTPEDVAAAVEFLLTSADYVTGAILPIDGGRSLA